MAVNANWAKMSANTGGTANLSLTAIGSYPSFTQAFGNANTQVYYVINGLGTREAGVGTYYPTNTTVGTLSRDTIVESWDGGASFSNTAVNFDTVGVDVFCGPIAQYLVHTETNQTLSGLKTFTANLVLATTAGLSANGSVGSNGQLLFSNGSTVYWGTATYASTDDVIALAIALG